ncbi:hypothetical protein KI809_11445 [Geobacter pelophilus]|uniref:Uncharacterized protein n=1 Tax=Geoanaerobacter pelophilus TaxID=60036 RepID=A0AAW4L8L1_9BACT|nr:hypothetical protein [Geoanaerobacter pelophilus]MBT0664915.1 hypothetical protein [Geoanaerobacter pelophilus]
MNAAMPSVATLLDLFFQGYARIPAVWGLDAPLECGLWWRPDMSMAVATPALFRLADGLPRREEMAGILLATQPRFRNPWLNIQAARLAELGRRKEETELCRAIDALGPAATTLCGRLHDARLEPTGYSALEVAVFGAPADQSAAAPGLLRVLGVTAPLVEGGQRTPVSKLDRVHDTDPRPNWVSHRLLQAPGGDACETSPHVLCGGLDLSATNRMAWVLGTPWATLLAHLVFMAEAWAAERQGGISLEVPLEYLERFAEPPQVSVVVTLADGREVLCGTLGEFCLRTLDALGMSLVPVLDARQLDLQLASVVKRLLKEEVWTYLPVARPNYVIGEGFSNDCYRGEGHRYIYRAGEKLTETLRSVCINGARSLTEGQSGERTT